MTIQLICFFILITVSIHSCGNGEDELFTKRDIKELDYFVKQFDELLHLTFKQNDSAALIQQYCAYIEYVDINDTIMSAQDFMDRHIDCFQQQYIIDSYNKLKKLRIFDDIWSKSYPIEPKKREIVDTTLSYNLKGKYYKYLKQLYDRDSKKYHIYYEVEMTGGNISPILVLNFQDKCKKYYDYDKNYRKISSIHYFMVCFNELAKKNQLLIE